MTSCYDLDLKYTPKGPYVDNLLLPIALGVSEGRSHFTRKHTLKGCEPSRFLGHEVSSLLCASDVTDCLTTHPEVREEGQKSGRETCTSFGPVLACSKQALSIPVSRPLLKAHKNPKGSIIRYSHMGKDLNMNAVKGHTDTIAPSALYSLHINQVSLMKVWINYPGMKDSV